MNRRTFLKALGLAIAAPGAVLGAVKATLSATSTLFGTKVIEANKRFWQQERNLAPVTVEGKDYYLVVMHPRQHYLLKVAIAKEKYKHEHWLTRHNRWLAKQGKSPHKDTVGCAGTLTVKPITIEDGLTEDDELRLKDVQLQIETQNEQR